MIRSISRLVSDYGLFRSTPTGISKFQIFPGANIVIQVAGKRWTAEDCIPPPTFDDKEVDAEASKRYLPMLPKVPLVPPISRGTRNYKVMRGPCLGEKAQFEYGQYGIIALKGGFLKACHLDMMRNHIMRVFRNKPYVFARYRVEAVHKPITKHPKNAVMGGGKGKIDYYVTPVKARQVLMEVGGKATFEEVYRILKVIAQKLPMPAIAVTKEKLEAMYEEEMRIEDENENFITFREVAEKNMQGMRHYLTTYDLKHFGKYK